MCWGGGHEHLGGGGVCSVFAIQGGGGGELKFFETNKEGCTFFSAMF